ncbi:DNA-binding transcriptional MerR regulator [Glycomyces artemisiae]|uniref:DNA-binding transcriptional MerR regulator n=1 Tax=Glycomyces artemisiae TaxID=1076443 RepID=A0A2T0UGD8_9ACTN|nr:DNA-binding transcriptional MerR regulator [Glycomyces artemisiae]
MDSSANPQAARVSSTAVDTYTIGECARRSGFTMDTLRYYERIGLIEDIARTPTGQRRFTDDHLEWLSVLKCLRDTGMPVEQMHRFATLARDGDHTIPERIAILQAHKLAVDARMDDLAAKRDYLLGKIDYYKSVA